MISSSIADNKFFVVFGIFLTIWALSGDDFRVMLTDKPADVAFDCTVIFCILFFSVEVVLSCLGKDDYFMGFFFGLDIISTFTLVLDLTFVADAFFNGGGGDDSDKARSSKTARAGARVGRVVRVLRLVRIVKLFKAMQQHNKDKQRIKVALPGADGDPCVNQEAVWETEEGEEDPQGSGRESLVGKKLSNRTTQRTSVLVLIMLIVLPLLSADSYMRTPASAEYGADDVLKAFTQMVSGKGTREAYEEMVLKYVYYHNWFLADTACPREAACSNWFYAQVFWVGLEGSEAAVGKHVAAAQIRSETVLKWNEMAAEQDDMYNYGTMPDEVLQVISSPWDSDCSFSGNSMRGFSLLHSKIPNLVSYNVDCPRQLRMTETEKFTPRLLTEEEYSAFHFVFYFDQRPYIHDEAVYNILKTVFVCVVLCGASLLFSSDANALVLHPVEHMITKVEQIRDHPLSAMKIADEEFKREEMKKMKARAVGTRNKIRSCYRNLCQVQSHELMETVILEKTIIKLGSLLALGFGEAGADIVRHNMKGSNSAFVDAMIEGTKVDCIVGNARIQDFSIATEVLQAKVMTFVNQVAEIVHGIVDQFHGAVNKNKGDTFLVIWRMRNIEEVTKLADMSVVAFTRIISAVHGSHMLAQYRHHPGLQQRLRERCRVNLSFGLHCGWAIEGAVGSEFKIDASYLSPNVSIAASIEQATRIYEVCLIVSEAVADLCTPEMAAKMRLIDKVRIRGSKQPLQLYSMDLDYMSLQVDEQKTMMVWNTAQRYLSRQLLEAEKIRKMQDLTPMADVFEACADIARMRRLCTFEFRHVFSMGYQNYTEGEWQVARSFLLKTQSMLGIKDGPSGALLRFMKTRHKFVAPAHWQGVHELGSLDDP